MSYTHEREQFIARMSREGLDMAAIYTLLRCATTMQRLAELACSSEAADRDRVPCPAAKTTDGVCLCDRYPDSTQHYSIPRIRLHDYWCERHAENAVPTGWSVLTQGDPRGYVLRVVPPSYAERNAGKDIHNQEGIGVPARESRLRF